MTDRERNLQKLLKMIEEAELLRLSALSAERNAATAAVVKLQTSQATRMQQVAALSEPDAAMSTGSDLKWQQWADRQCVRLREVEAEAAADQDRQRDRARKAFGRLQAFNSMLRKQEDRRRG